MPRIKLKPHLKEIEVGIGNLVNFKISTGETVEVAEELLEELLSGGHFENDDEKGRNSDREPLYEDQEHSDEEETAVP